MNSDQAVVEAARGLREVMSRTDRWDWPTSLAVRSAYESLRDALALLAEPANDDFEPDLILNPCEICGEWGPCGYDAGGRPMSHLHTGGILLAEREKAS
jgi:hypothetical protein